MSKKLYRSESDRMIAGVCGGIAEVYDIDPALVRIITALLVLSGGTGLLIYVIAALVIPTESEVKGSEEVEEVSVHEEPEEE